MLCVHATFNIVRSLQSLKVSSWASVIAIFWLLLFRDVSYVQVWTGVGSVLKAMCACDVRFRNATELQICLLAVFQRSFPGLSAVVWIAVSLRKE